MGEGRRVERDSLAGTTRAFTRRQTLRRVGFGPSASAATWTRATEASAMFPSLFFLASAVFPSSFFSLPFPSAILPS